MSNSKDEHLKPETHLLEATQDHIQVIMEGQNDPWVESLRYELTRKHKVTVGSRPNEVFRHYGWLIEVYLQKMGTPIGRERTLRRLSFMAEAYQSSLRYLCYIQLAQVLQHKSPIKSTLISDFLQIPVDEAVKFDYLILLQAATKLLTSQAPFMPELVTFVNELFDPGEELYQASLFLDTRRTQLMTGQIKEGPHLSELLDEYLTTLVYWLRRISFIAKYRLISIKDISLNYRMGTPQNFVHFFGELHGMYLQAISNSEDYMAKTIQGDFTFNQSVLLFRGNNVDACLEGIGDPTTYLSLSPLVIDKSVYSEKPTQTPEIYYFTGKGSRTYAFAQYKNELEYDIPHKLTSNKTLEIKRQNMGKPRLDELFEHLEQIFQPQTALFQ